MMGILVGKKLNHAAGLANTRPMVPGAGLEPARPYDREILSLLCLPISPPGRVEA